MKANVLKNRNIGYELLCRALKETVLYDVIKNAGQCAVVKPCMLSEAGYNTFPFVRYFDKDMNLDRTRSVGSSWDSLFIDKSEADIVAAEINERLVHFRHSPFLSDELIKKHFTELTECEELINKLLSNFDNYDGIDFCNVNANGIQVRIHHKQIKGYTYGKQHTILYDFSNIKEIPLLVVKEFIDIDNPHAIMSQQSFIASGEKYGWD